MQESFPSEVTTGNFKQRETVRFIASYLLVQGQFIWILHYPVVIVVIITSCCSHDWRWCNTLSVLLSHLNKVVKTHMGAGCKDTRCMLTYKYSNFLKHDILQVGATHTLTGDHSLQDSPLFLGGAV